MEIDNGGEFLVRGLKALVKDAIGELDMIGDICVLGGDKHSKQRNISLHNAHNLIVTACYF